MSGLAGDDLRAMFDEGLPQFDGSQECAGVDTELFFPEKRYRGMKVRKLCRVCEWAEPCLTYALGSPQVVGIWGGTDEKERAEIRRINDRPKAS